MDIFIWIAYLIIVLSLIYGIRNTFVSNFRHSLLLKISKSSREDIDIGIFDYQRRYQIYNTVTYHTQVFKFWKPLKYFWSEKSFKEMTVSYKDMMVK